MDSDQKLKFQAATIAFGLVVIIYQVFFNFGDDFTLGSLMLGLFLGVVAGAVTFGVMTVLNK